MLSAVAQANVQLQRRQRAANEFHDGVLLLHANSTLDLIVDGFHQDPYFYYFTGLENTIGAILVIDGKGGESWLFLPPNQPYSKRGLQPDVLPGAQAAKRLGIDHVVDWAELESFLASRAALSANLYYAADTSKRPELPDNLLNSKAREAPSWLQMILQRWPALSATEVSRRVDGLMEAQSVDEMAALRGAAKPTVAAYMAGNARDSAQRFAARGRGRGHRHLLEGRCAWRSFLALGYGRRKCGVSASLLLRSSLRPSEPDHAFGRTSAAGCGM